MSDLVEQATEVVGRLNSERQRKRNAAAEAWHAGGPDRGILTEQCDAAEALERDAVQTIVRLRARLAAIRKAAEPVLKLARAFEYEPPYIGKGDEPDSIAFARVSDNGQGPYWETITLADLRALARELEGEG